jgi:formamidopyrimidine-DNA glycosylase
VPSATAAHSLHPTPAASDVSGAARVSPLSLRTPTDRLLDVLSSVAVPELPEVETVRRSLVPGVVGRRVEAVACSGARLRLPVDAEAWRRLTVGRRIEGLDRRGKYLLLGFGDAVGVIHLGMSGRIALAPASSPRARHTHLELALEGGLALRLVDPRRFGVAVALDAAELEAFPPIAALGSDPLHDDIVPALVRARRSRVAIRNVLLDQRIIAGIGNIYANEALHRAAVHPATPAARLGPRRMRRLAAAIGSVLDEALQTGGTTLRDGGFVDAAGEAGRFVVWLAVYGRAGEPCPRCGAPIKRLALGGRSAFFCPRCQRV